VGYKESCSKYYNIEAENYDSRRYYCNCRKFHDELSKDTVYQFIKDKEYILDVGTGTGRFSTFLAYKGKTVVALDQSEEMLLVAEKKSLSLGVNNRMEFVKGDVEELPFNDNEFDAVISIHVMTHFKDINKFLSEVSRVLKPGGILVFDHTESIFIRWYHFLRVDVLNRSMSFPDYFQKLQHIRSALKCNSVEIIDSKKIKKTPRFLTHFLTCTLNSTMFMNLLIWVEKFNFGALRIIKCQKID